MLAAENPHDKFGGLSPRVAAGLAWGLALGLVCLEAVAPLEYVVSVGYGVPIVLAAWTRCARTLWALVVTIAVLDFAVRVGGGRSLDANELTNYVMSVVRIGLIAALVHFWIRTRNRVDEQRNQLESQNAALEAANRDISQREEEIAHQNEELQSQAEELERQTEELRVSNEELASWEKMLEQLLELSRSLTADLTRSEMFDKICEALATLSGPNASAILQKQHDDLEISCHHGFGPEGLRAKKLPYAQSFAKLVMSLGQTGYLEDIRLRPDLHFPQPLGGEPFRSVLSSPLRIHGQCVGTVEIYGAEAAAWDELQIAMIESMAAQASISLQSAELVEAIRQERRRFEAAFRTVPFGMAVAEDPQGSVIRLNPAAAAMFNLPLDENIARATPAGFKLRQCFFQAGENVPEDQLPVSRALRGEEVYSEELDLVLPKGRRQSLLVSAAPICDRNGQTMGAVAAFVDISTQKDLQRELEIRRREAEEASLRKTRFLAAVSHDIRTPANAISLMAELISRDSTDPARAPRIADMARRLQDNTHSLVELVGDVLDVARFDSGKVELVESDFSLADCLDDECRQLAPLATQKHLSLSITPLDRPIWLRTDRVKLGRILGNLIGNAIKFTETGGVTVSAGVTAEPDRRVLVRVADTGIGIAPENLSSIFDEFAQLHNPARDRSKGTGLGLAICKRLAEVMNCTISVESTLNVGSVFSVGLPASSINVRLDSVARGPASGAKFAPARPALPLELRVLLVEDHQTTREGTARILEDEGATVIEAHDGATALNLMQTHKPEVVLLDMMLPDMDGREILDRIKTWRPSGLRAVLVLTGDVTKERLDEIEHLGADGLIEKPINVQKLLSALQDIHRNGRSH